MARLLLALLFAFGLSAADVTGKWAGEVTFQTPDGQGGGGAYANFTQNGAALTGTAGPQFENQFPILEGKVNGDTLEFKVRGEMDGAEVTYNIAANIIGDRIEGTIKVVGAPEGAPSEFKMTMTRSK